MQISPNITRAFGKIALQAKKNAPTILIATGVVAGVAATGTAIHATLKCDDILKMHEENMKNIEKAKYGRAPVRQAVLAYRGAHRSQCHLRPHRSSHDDQA